ncbi:MAG: hypothetical protein COA74_04690 [Gammaproteobacteria bacterium]|nr:MAG: hypothetical protein COA74_04690 [Gammaproteobacteria bacterium]
MKKLHEFNSREDWVNYAMNHMRNIEAQRREENGVEILLVAKRGIIGKWSDETGYGYIEEYRDDNRLADGQSNTEDS